MKRLINVIQFWVLYIEILNIICRLILLLRYVKTLVRSHLEYANCVWSPYRQMDIEKNRKGADESDQNGSMVEKILF